MPLLCSLTKMSQSTGPFPTLAFLGVNKYLPLCPKKVRREILLWNEQEAASIAIAKEEVFPASSWPLEYSAD